MSDIDLVEQKVDTLTATVFGLRDEVKELTKALRELIRIDGDIKRLSEAIGRIGGESEDHEARLRVLESRGGRRMEALITHGLSVGIGCMVMFLIGKL